MKHEKYKIFTKRQTLAESVMSNVITFTVIAFCAWVSQGSTWWTFLTGILFLFWFFTRCAAVYKENMNEFKTKAELLEWANSLPEDS